MKPKNPHTGSAGASISTAADFETFTGNPAFSQPALLAMQAHVHLLAQGVRPDLAAMLAAALLGVAGT